jgi:EAL domain-containing protein (putative c-di-GMP-specific phosphodiesterase class I)
LRDYPVSRVKIDKSFTRHVGLDPRSCSIIDALVGISRSRRMDLVAEGVETAAEWEALQHLGVRLFQGYLFAPPMEADAFADLLEDPDQLSRRHGRLSLS